MCYFMMQLGISFPCSYHFVLELRFFHASRWKTKYNFQKSLCFNTWWAINLLWWSVLLWYPDQERFEEKKKKSKLEFTERWCCERKPLLNGVLMRLKLGVYHGNPCVATDRHFDHCWKDGVVSEQPPPPYFKRLGVEDRWRLKWHRRTGYR